MTTVVLTTDVAIRSHMRMQADNTRLDHWHRLGCLAWVHADRSGHARFATGQVGRELGLSVKQVSTAISKAKAKCWIDPCSTARCIVLTGHALNPCEERHVA